MPKLRAAGTGFWENSPSAPARFSQISASLNRKREVISAKDIKPAGGPSRPQSPPPSPEITVAAAGRAEELQTGP